MHIPPLSADDLEKPDSELGRHFGDLFIFAEAANRGMGLDSIPEGFGASLLPALASIEADNARLAPVALALRKYVVGDFEAAGRLIREYLTDGAENLAIAKKFIEQSEKFQKGPKRGGASTKAKRQAWKEYSDRRIMSEVKKLEDAGRDDREIAGIVARKLGFSDRHIRRVRKENKAD